MPSFRLVAGLNRAGLAALTAGALLMLGLGATSAGVKPGDPKPFLGEWMMAFPESAGNIVNKPIISCDDLAVISAGPDGMISIRTPKGDAGNWAVKSFGKRNPLWRDDDIVQTLVAEWIDGDRFLLAGKDASGAKTDWSNAKQWTRCE